jgi:hypothetical protein
MIRQLVGNLEKNGKPLDINSNHSGEVYFNLGQWSVKLSNLQNILRT